MSIIKFTLKIFSSLKKTIKIEFIRNVITLTTGTVIAQLIPFLVIPLLTRLFSDEIFGLFFLYSSITMVLAILATLKYELAIVLPDKNEEAANLLALSLIVTFLVSGLVLTLIILLYNPIITLIGNEKIGNWLYFIPISILSLGTFQALSYWSNRHKHYKTMSYAKVSRSVSANSFHIGLGFSVLQKFGLIPGMIFGQFVGSIFILFTTLKNFRYLFDLISLKKILYVAKKYKDIPLYNTLIGVLNILSQQLPIFILTKFFNLSHTGHYGLTYKVIGTPTGMIQQSVGEVFYQKASEKYNQKGDFYKFVKKTYLGLFKIAFIPYSVIFGLSFYFGYIFGPDWEITGKYARVIIPWLFVAFINSPIIYVLTIINKQKILLLYHILMIVFRFAALYTGYAIYNNVFLSITLFSIIGVIFNLFLLFYAFMLITKNLTRKTY